MTHCRRFCNIEIIVEDWKCVFFNLVYVWCNTLPAGLFYCNIYIYIYIYKEKRLSLPLHKTFSFTKSSSSTRNLSRWWLRFSKNWKAEASTEYSISYHYLKWRIHQLSIYIYLLSFFFVFLFFVFFWSVFKKLCKTSKKDQVSNLREWKNVPQPAACPIGKMNSWQPNNNDKYRVQGIELFQKLYIGLDHLVPKNMGKSS